MSGFQNWSVFSLICVVGACTVPWEVHYTGNTSFGGKNELMKMDSITPEERGIGSLLSAMLIGYRSLDSAMWVGAVPLPLQRKLNSCIHGRHGMFTLDIMGLLNQCVIRLMCALCVGTVPLPVHCRQNWYFAGETKCSHWQSSEFGINVWVVFYAPWYWWKVPHQPSSNERADLIETKLKLGW